MCRDGVRRSVRRQGRWVGYAGGCLVMLRPRLTGPWDEQMTVLGLFLPERVAERTGLSELWSCNAFLCARRGCRCRLLTLGAGRQRRRLSLAHHLWLRARRRSVWAGDVVEERARVAVEGRLWRVERCVGRLLWQGKRVQRRKWRTMLLRAVVHGLGQQMATNPLRWSRVCGVVETAALSSCLCSD